MAIGNMSQYLQSGVLENLFGGNNWPRSNKLWVALASGTLISSMTGGLGSNEVPNAGAYARQELDPSDANWKVGGGIVYVNGSGSAANQSAITFPQASAAWAGQVTDVAICDSGVYGAGNMLWFGKLAVPKTVGQNDQFSFAIGNLAIYMD